MGWQLITINWSISLTVNNKVTFNQIKKVEYVMTNPHNSKAMKDAMCSCRHGI